METTDTDVTNSSSVLESNLNGENATCEARKMEWGSASHGFSREATWHQKLALSVTLISVLLPLNTISSISSTHQRVSTASGGLEKEA